MHNEVKVSGRNEKQTKQNGESNHHSKVKAPAKAATAATTANSNAPAFLPAADLVVVEDPAAPVAEDPAVTV